LPAVLYELNKMPCKAQWQFPRFISFARHLTISCWFTGSAFALHALVLATISITIETAHLAADEF
jgi:hypothetical protein